MEKNILIINIGSSSKKYHVYSNGESLINAHFEHDKDGFIVAYDEKPPETISREDYDNSLSHFCATAEKSGYISQTNPISSIGLRVVAPGEYFTKDHVVDAEFIEKLEVVAKRDSAHIGPTRTELDLINKLFPSVKIVAVSDSSFHSTMPQVARSYAIPTKLAEERDIYRFGFHGLSISSIVRILAARPSGIEKRAIVCHLGSGASVTALLEGKSVDTSMGYSPLEGLVMSSRVGNIDAGAVLCLTDKQTTNELQQLFYSESGLLALSNLSEDMRILLEAEKNGHAGAHLAVEAFVYNICKYIGAYSAVLGGVEAIIFSGMIGERSDVLRERICGGLGYLNVHIDVEKNKNVKNSENIAKDGSVCVYALHGDEAGEILRKTMEVSG